MGIAIRKVLALKAQAKERYTKGFAISRCKALFKGMFTRRRHPEVCAVAVAVDMYLCSQCGRQVADVIRWMHEDRLLEVEQAVALRLQATVRGRLSRLKCVSLV